MTKKLEQNEFDLDKANNQEQNQTDSFRVYQTVDGAIPLSKEEFEAVVEYFRTLKEWRDGF